MGFVIDIEWNENTMCRWSKPAINRKQWLIFTLRIWHKLKVGHAEIRLVYWKEYHVGFEFTYQIAFRMFTICLILNWVWSEGQSKFLIGIAEIQGWIYIY